MKRLVTPLLFIGEVGLAYLWLGHEIAAAGRILLFYYWVIAILVMLIGMGILIVATISKTRKPLPEAGRTSRIIGWAFLVIRVAGLVALAHQVLGAVYLASSLLFRFGLAIYRDLPEGV